MRVFLLLFLYTYNLFKNMSCCNSKIKPMLLPSNSIAFALQTHCFYTSKAMLFVD